MSSSCPRQKEKTKAHKHHAKQAVWLIFYSTAHTHPWNNSKHWLGVHNLQWFHSTWAEPLGLTVTIKSVILTILTKNKCKKQWNKARCSSYHAFATDTLVFQFPALKWDAMCYQKQASFFLFSFFFCPLLWKRLWRTLQRRNSNHKHKLAEKAAERLFLLFYYRNLGGFVQGFFSWKDN